MVAGRPDLKRIEQTLARASQLAGRGRAMEADALCRPVLAAVPRLAAAHFVAGEIAEAKKQPEAAIGCYRRATELDPDYYPGWLNLGVCLRDRGDYEGAVTAYEQAIRIDPRSAQAHNNLASLYVKTNEFDKAVKSFETALKLQPGSAALRRGLARIYLRIMRLEPAITLARSALELDSSHAETWELLGNCLQAEGQFEEAEAAFLEALERDPRCTSAHYGLAMMKRSPALEATAIRSIEGMLAEGSEEIDGQVGLHFAAAYLYERNGDHDTAFSHYRTGNTLRFKEGQFTEEGSRKLFDALKQTFSADLFKAPPFPGNPTRVPVFIVGMPRSGTTLIEQIVTSHPKAAAAGELLTMRDLVDAKNRVDQERNHFDLPDEAEAARMAAVYLDTLTRERRDAVRVTDKLPFNFYNIGMIHLLFPNAKIIHCCRNPIDTCLSCYFQNFRDYLSFSLELESLGHYYRLYDDLMRHWKSVLPHPFLEVQYERITADPETAIREIINFCDLPWDDACLSPHESRGAVGTASVWQVRQPIYRNSVAKWKRYDRHLGPLKTALGDLFMEDAS